MTQTNASSMREMFSYSSIGFSSALLNGVISSFALYYCTDVALIPTATASIILFIARFFEGAIDPFIGHYMDGRQTRHGKYRGYIIYWALPYSVSFALMFISPSQDANTTAVWFCASYILFGVSSSMIEEAYLPLLVTISSDKKQRHHLNTARILMSILATLIARLHPSITAFAGKGSEHNGYLAIAVVYAAISCPMLILGATGVHERNISSSGRAGFKQTISVLARSKPLILLLAFFLLNQMASSIKSQTAIYYMKYYINKPQFTSLFLTIGIASSLATQPLILWAVKRTNHVNLIVAGLFASGASMLLIGFAGQSVGLMLVSNILYGVVSAFPANLVYVCIADMADAYIQQQNQNHSALINSLLGLTSKLSQAVSGPVIALLLYLSSYVPDIAAGRSVSSIQFTFVILTALLYIAAGIMALAYRRIYNIRGKIQ